MKIALLGAGSLFFERVIAEMARTPELRGAELMLYDPDQKRMRLIKQVGQRINTRFKARFKIVSARERARALDGADIAIASIGVHGPARKWHRIDVEVAAEFGIMQSTGDTVGPAGLSQGLRIIPIFVEIARDMERYCPECFLLNHSNPMGPICRAVAKTSSIRAIGYCHNVAGGLKTFAEALGVKRPEELDVIVGGVNHMVWLLSIRHRGKDVYPEFRKRFLAAPPQHTRIFTRELMEIAGLYLIGGDRHIIEFFPDARRASDRENMLYGMNWRLDTIKKNLLGEELTIASSELELRASGKKPLRIDSKMSPEAMGLQVKALLLGPDKVHVVNVPNAGALKNLPDWAVVELKSVVGQHGARPVEAGELPPVAARWTLAQIYAHELTVDAAIEGSREKAVQALACDPMIRDLGEARKIFQATVKAQGDRLARFRLSRSG